MDASRDHNFIPGKLGVLFTDPSVTIPIGINSVTGGMLVNTVDTVQFTMTPVSPEDQNYVNCMLWVGTDGLTYPWVVDAIGAVLIDH